VPRFIYLFHVLFRWPRSIDTRTEPINMRKHLTQAHICDGQRQRRDKRMLSTEATDYIANSMHYYTHSITNEVIITLHYIHTYILTLYPWRGSRGITDILPKHPSFTKIIYKLSSKYSSEMPKFHQYDLALKNTADMTNGKLSPSDRGMFQGWVVILILFIRLLRHRRKKRRAVILLFCPEYYRRHKLC
jgi:hypothetical protein